MRLCKIFTCYLEMEWIMNRIILRISVALALCFIPVVTLAQTKDIRLSLGCRHKNYAFPSQSIVKTGHYYCFSQNRIDDVLMKEDTLFVNLGIGDLLAVFDNNRVIAFEMTICHSPRTIVHLPVNEAISNLDQCRCVVVQYGFIKYHFQRRNVRCYKLLRVDKDTSISNIKSNNIPIRER